MRFLKRVFVLALIAQSSTGMAAWYLNKSVIGTASIRGVEIDDKPHAFNHDGLLCEVSATTFTRHGDQIIESRQLVCLITEDASVSTFVTCNLPLFEMSNMSITKKGRFYAPTLTCGPKTK